MLAVDKVHHNAAHAGNHRHAHGMAENGRLRCELLFKNLPCGFEIVVVQRLNAGLLGGGSKVAHIGVAELGARRSERASESRLGWRGRVWGDRCIRCFGVGCGQTGGRLGLAGG